MNEQAVIGFLAPRGFEVVRLEAMSLAEQIDAFSHARMVIGPHGSGLTNILFGPANLALVELHPADEVNHVYWVLASALQQRYAFLSGPVVNANRDFSIDLSGLEELLAKLSL